MSGPDGIALGVSPHRLVGGTLAVVALACATPAVGLDFKAGGRITFGASYRLEAPDPALLNSLNASAGQSGVVGLANGATNSDDGNINFHRHDATATVLKGYLDLSAGAGTFGTLVRVKAWRDFALADQPRAWGNSPNDYTAGQPLSDRGAPALSRFSGIALADYYVEDSVELGAVRLFGRVGQQSIGWGERSSFAGGLEAINPRDFPAMRRPGAVPQEVKVPVPALFARLDASPDLGFEAFYQTRFRPSAVDMCGTFLTFADYLADGCDRVFAGPPAGSDRARVQNGAYLKRMQTPSTSGREQYGLAATWKAAAIGTDFGVYRARYTARTATPGMRKSSRLGPALIPGDPDGMNLRYFTEYVDGIDLYAFTFVHKRPRTSVFGELAYRPNQPLQLSSGDAIGAFMNATAPSLLRAQANATAPGALFHGFDRYRTLHAQLGVQHDWSTAGGTALSGGAEVVAKHVGALPDQSVRRYLRPDQYGLGPVGGVCTVSTATPGKQCSKDGYVSSNAYAYRLRLDARYAGIVPGLNGVASAVFTHDVKGWSYDAVVSEGRQTLNLALRFEYRQRYVAEIVYSPIWGGDYNAMGDRDQLAIAAGIRF
jgi:hypothetical protein